MQLSHTVLDEGIMDSLRDLQAHGGPDFLVQLTTAFVEDGSMRLVDLRTGLNERDDLRVRQAAHSLKGMSGALGATDMAGLCSTLEQQAVAAAVDASLAAQIEIEFTRVTAALRSLI